MPASDAATVPAPPLPAAAVDELKAILQANALANERAQGLVLERLGAISARQDSQERVSASLQTQVRAVVEEQGRVAERQHRLEAAQGPVDDAMRSQHEIDLGFREDLKRIETTVMLKLEEQDRLQKDLAAKAKLEAESRDRAKKEEADARAAAETEERRRESIAAKTLADDRAQKNLESQERTKRQAIMWPVIGSVLVALMGAMGFYFNGVQSRAAAEQAETRQADRYRALATKIEAVSATTAASTVEAPPPPAAAAPAPPARRAK